MTNFPLCWPAGWRRTTPEYRKSSKFNKKTYQSDASGQGGYYRSGELSISDGVKRVMQQLRAFGVAEGDAIVSTNLQLRLDGLPRSDQKAPQDPGVAIYWKRRKDQIYNVMAIDLYDRVADNLAAIAATLEAMRAIERHGGAVILERAFVGFASLPAPNTWRSVLKFKEDSNPTLDAVTAIYRMLSKQYHPDVGGSEAKMQELNWAIKEAERDLGR